ncbi:hypothetical protein [Amycolatopsis jejuensis]|uniref:hypothetical protein n=1 Tax=Amycolatopsis jejuensis TaxID=330084 RepID=UPI0005273473|nr:hypothetical protein [Amycolatopsis jejuensis]
MRKAWQAIAGYRLLLLGAVLLTLWFALFRPLLSGRPGELPDFAALCGADGQAFDKAAAYEGPAPHPIIVFEGGSTVKHADNGAGDRPQPDQVQLVGCLRSLGVGAELDGCSYRDGSVRTMRQGRWQIEVHEARTGRVVSTVDLNGRTGECPTVVSREHESPGGTVAPSDIRGTEPDETAYREALRSAVKP